MKVLCDVYVLWKIFIIVEKINRKNIVKIFFVNFYLINLLDKIRDL